jgi:dUTPase
MHTNLTCKNACNHPCYSHAASHESSSPRTPSTETRKSRPPKLASPISFPSLSKPIQQEMSATSPPTSPLPKRLKPNPSIMETTNPVTKVDAQPSLLIKKLSDKARLPTRGSAFAAGYDIYAAKDTVVPARGKVLVDTDISMAVPAGTCTFAPVSFWSSAWG